MIGVNNVLKRKLPTEELPPPPPPPPPLKSRTSDLREGFELRMERQELAQRDADNAAAAASTGGASAAGKAAADAQAAPTVLDTYDMWGVSDDVDAHTWMYDRDKVTLVSTVRGAGGEREEGSYDMFF